MTDRLILGPFHYLTMCIWDLGQQSPMFLVPGTGFVEDNFPTDWCGRGGLGCFKHIKLSCTFLFLLH